MLKRLWPKKRCALGLDISSASVKILEVSKQANHYSIEACGQSFLSEEIIESDSIKDIDSLASVIKELISNAKITTKSAILAVPDGMVTSKKILVHQSLNASEMEEFITLEAEKYLPFPLQDSYFDYQVLGTFAKNTTQKEVLVVASRSENIIARVKAANRAGLAVNFVDIQSFALERVLQWLLKNLPAIAFVKKIAVVEIEARYIRVVILQEQKIIFMREEEHRTEESTDIFLVWQVKRILQFFYSMDGEEGLGKILLIGLLSEHWAVLFEKQLGISAQMANPFHGMSSGRTSLKKMPQEGSSFLLACGLALRAFKNGN